MNHFERCINTMAGVQGMHSQVAWLLEHGHIVKSLAVGAVGEVVDTNPPYCIIKLKSGELGARTFEQGDKVYLKQIDGDVWHIVNVWPDSSRLQLDKKRKHRAF